jgi:hypothetical protein
MTLTPLMIYDSDPIDEVELENAFHEFVSEKPDWFKIGDNAKQFDGHPHD